jgi:hypothetical protein
MHGAFLIYFSICVEIIAITVVLNFLLKATKDGVGGLLKWAAYIALLAGFLILVCTFTRGIMQMTHHPKDGMENCCGGGNCSGMGHCGGGHMMMMCGHCEEGECDMKDDKECCKDSTKGHHDMKGMDHMDKDHKDTTKAR